VSLRTLVVFLEIVIPDPWGSFSFFFYSELTGISTKGNFKCARGSGGAKIRLMARAIAYISFAKQISVPPIPLANFKRTLLKSC
jgi:hypothetical protein